MNTQNKIAFIIGGHDTWMVVKSVYDAAKARNKHCYVVLLKCGSEAYYVSFMNELRKQGVEVYYAHEYKIENDLPDVCIYDFDWHTYGGDYVSVEPQNAKKYAKKIVMIPYDMIVYDGYGSVSQISKRYLRSNADMCFVNPDYYEKFKPYQNNLIMTGNPKFDYIYEKCVMTDKYIPDEWKRKINGKKVIMWATTHGLDNKNITPLYTFDIWVKDIIDFFRAHREYVLLFRPSKRIFDDLILNNVCSYDECKNFENIFNEEENFIFDKTDEYGFAYNVSDALLCPPNGMLMSYLPTRKPIIYTATYRTNYSFNDQQLIQNYYIIKNKAELEKAIDNIFYHSDPLYEKRMETLEQYVPHFDGRIGERIMEQILKKINK